MNQSFFARTGGIAVMHRLRRFCLVLVLGCCIAAIQAAEVPLAADHPQRYTVVKGDTLWDIAARFLKNPWDWPKIWKANPRIKNPHWIYPGDVLVLQFDNGRPYLTLQRENPPPGVEKLAPTIRERPVTQAIPTIPYEAVRQFLTTPKVVSRQELETAPYIISLADNRLIGGSGDTLYVRRFPENATEDSYTVFRPDDAIRDPETKEVLGYNALYVADSHLRQRGDPAVLEVDRSVREILVGDRLLPVGTEQLALDYYPQPAPKSVRGHIVKVLDGVSQIGQYALVVIDRGTRDGLQKGHVLKVWRHGVRVLDNLDRRSPEWVTLPDEEEGWVMIFRPFERVSYGIVMKAMRAIHIGDLVTAPDA
ncbi:LysM peptidoglycan-binding domain-containing protein [Methylomarinovum tepidoasis]|nr:LysM peptidoglycan-binding domain-containing protein [Methylomarinovum sp. IN45]